MSVRKRIAVIGAGPGGLSAAKALALEPAHFSVDVFDRRDRIGGVWYYHGDKTKVSPPIPSVNPNGLEILSKSGGFENRYMSSMYKNLETNLIDELMEYSNLDFGPTTDTFRDRIDVLKYLDRYRATIPESVSFRLKTNVVSVEKPGSQWKLHYEDTDTLEASQDTYDAIVVSNGHCDVPYIPPVSGLEEWNEKHPQSVSHSRYFVDAAPYKDRVVLIIGNSSSGLDMATQIGATAKFIYVSTKGDLPADSDNEYIKYTAEVKHYNASDKTVLLTDGTIIVGIDVIMYCTGYLYSLPFLQKYRPDLTDGIMVKDLYLQLFNVQDPSLMFLGLPKFITPLPLCESQAAVAARVLSERIQLPSLEERKKAYEAELSAKGTGKDFHSLKDCDFEYCNKLFSIITENKTENSGLVPIFWDEERIGKRNTAASLKKARNDSLRDYTTALRGHADTFTFPP